jgi:D-3-phosphoglycerate dehydrogenase
MKILVCDKLESDAIEQMRAAGLVVDVRDEITAEELPAVLPAYDGMVVRSRTKVRQPLIEACPDLKVIVRGGVGLDTIDADFARARGIIVMNTPLASSASVAELAIGYMFALARDTFQATSSMKAEKWEKKKFEGQEVGGKTLGLIGIGHIGTEVALRAHALGMTVIAYDPYVKDAPDVRLVSLEELLAKSDYISLHLPKTKESSGMLGKEAFAKMKAGVRIINCARGGLVAEADLAEALKSGHVAGAGFDVFEEEPATASPLFGLPNVICTPHLGASTSEAQENVALQVAEQMCDYLLSGAISNAVNFPSISAEEAPKLRPFVKLAEQLGSFAGQLTETGITMIRLEYAGEVAEMNTKALTSAALAGVLRPSLQDVNMVSAPVIAKQRGIMVEEVRRGQEGAYETYMRVTVKAEKQGGSVGGTVFSDGKPRLIQINKISMDAEFTPYMLYTENADKPGHIGALGTLLGTSGVNIATFNLGREEAGGKAVALVSVDEPIGKDVLAEVTKLPHVRRAALLKF